MTAAEPGVDYQFLASELPETELFASWLTASAEQVTSPECHGHQQGEYDQSTASHIPEPQPDAATQGKPMALSWSRLAV